MMLAGLIIWAAGVVLVAAGLVVGGRDAVPTWTVMVLVAGLVVSAASIVLGVIAGAVRAARRMVSSAGDR